MKKRYFFILFITMFLLTTNAKAQDNLYSGYSFNTTFYGGATVGTDKVSSNSSPYWIYRANRAISGISYNIIRAYFTSNSSFVSTNNNYATGAIIIGKDTTLDTNLTGISVNMADKPCEVNVFNSFTGGTMYVSYSCYSSTGWEINTSHNLTIFVGGWSWSGNERAWVAISDIEFVSYEDVSTKVDETNRILANIDNNISLTRNTINDNLNALISAISSSNNNLSDIKNGISETNETLNDSSIDTSSSDSSTSGFNDTTNSGMSNTPVSNLITLPITFLTGVNSAISGSCTNVNYIELFGYQLTLPCLNLSERLGNVWVIIDTICSCMLIFSIGKSLVGTFARLSDMDTNIMYECYANGVKHRGESFND